METFTRKVNIARYVNPVEWLKKARDKDGYDIAISPELQQKYMSKWNTRISGLYLQKPMSVVTNMTGAYKNLVKSGIGRTKDALSMMYSKRFKSKIEDLVQQSGITNFSDFFSNQMVNGIVEQQLEAQVSEAIMKEMLRYYANQKGGILGKKMSESDARKEFNANVAKFLKMSQVWMKAEQLEIRDRARTKKALRSLKADMKMLAANKLVNWAIDKKYELKPLVNQGTIKRWIQIPFGKLVGIHAQIFEMLPVDFTKSGVEKGIRVLSFIIGVDNAYNTGVLRNDVHWTDYKDPADIDAAIKIGREYSLWVNYGMSMQNVAPYQWGPAQFFGKFKYWSQLNAEDDLSIFTELLNSFKDKNLNFKDQGRDKPGKTLNFKPILKSLASITSLKLGNKGRRIAKPEVAAARTLFLSQTALQTAWNLAFLNPLNMKNYRLPMAILGGLKSVVFGTPLGGQIRNLGSSDLIYWLSVALMMPIKGLLLGDGWFGDDDELEDIDRTIMEHLQHNPWMGFGSTWAASGFMWAVAAMAEDEELFKQKGKSVMSILFGRPSLSGLAQGPLKLTNIIDRLMDIPLDVLIDSELDTQEDILGIDINTKSKRGRRKSNRRSGRRSSNRRSY